MTTRAACLAVWAAVAALVLACELVSLRGARVGGLARLRAAVTASVPRRAAALLCWMWLGWHLFAR